MASIKPSYNTKRTVLGKQLPLDTPFAVVLDLSESCNFKCCYCFRAGKKDESWSFAAKGDLMSQAVFEHAARQLKEFPQKLKLISLSGHGEPLCNPHIVDMVRFLKKLDVAEQIDMHTNASLLTEESAVRIAQAGFTRIVVSLQGMDAAAYKRTCGAKIDFQQFYNNLKLMYEKKDKSLRIHIKIADAAFGKDAIQESERNFYALFGGIADNVSVEKAVPLWQNLNFDTDTTANKFGYAFGEVNYCSLLFYKMLVAPGGEIYPCTNLPPPMSLGNIRDITLQEAWNSRKRLTFLQEHLRLTRYKNAHCKGCFVPVNTVTAPGDIIDPYRDAVLDRLEDLIHNE